MADIPTPEQVEAIRERHHLVSDGDADWCDYDGLAWPCERAALLAAYDTLTAEVQRLRRWLASKPNPADDDDQCPTCGCPTSCPEGLHDRAEAAERKVAAVRATLAGHPSCDVHPDGDPITCGWRRAVADAALDGEG